MINLDKEYRYRGTHPRIRGVVGNITNIINEDFVEFSVFEAGFGFEVYRVRFTSLELIND